jgi:hypothetical protein
MNNQSETSASIERIVSWSTVDDKLDAEIVTRFEDG